MNARFKASFGKDLKNIKNPDVLARIKDAIEGVEAAQTLQDVAGLKKLKGGGNTFRLRIGEFRIGILLEKDSVVFVRCLNRKEIYRYFP